MTAGNPAPGRRSRAWSATGGHVQDLNDEGADIRLDTHVTAVPGRTGPPPGSDYSRIVQLSASTVAVAQLAAQLRTPVGIAAAEVAALRRDGWVETKAPLELTRDSVVTDALLRRVRDRLRAI